MASRWTISFTYARSLDIKEYEIILFLSRALFLDYSMCGDVVLRAHLSDLMVMFYIAIVPICQQKQVHR